MKEITLANEGVKAAGEGNFKPLEVGEYDACIHGIVNLGLRAQSYQGQPKPPKIVFKVIFEIPEQVRDDDQTQVIAKKYTVSAHKKSNWFKLIKLIGGEDINEKTILQYPLSKILGKGCRIKVDHWEKDEDTKIAVIQEVNKLDSRLPQPEGTRENFLFSPNDPDLEVFENLLTYYTQKEIMEALDAEQFPKELHASWVKIEEEKAKAQGGTTESVSGNTESIE